MLTYREAFDSTDIFLFRVAGLVEAIDALVESHEGLSGNHPKTSGIDAVLEAMRATLTEVHKGRDIERGIIAGAGFLGAKSATCPGAPDKVSLPKAEPQHMAKGG